MIDLPKMQKKINFHYFVTLDLFGAEISTNASNAYNASLKGRFRETTIDDDHLLHDSTYPVRKHGDGKLVSVDEPGKFAHWIAHPGLASTANPAISSTSGLLLNKNSLRD